MSKSLDTEVKEFITEVGKSVCKKAGLAATVSAFYLGNYPNPNDTGDFDEVANELGLSRKDANYWEDLWYKKDSWFNNLD